MWADGSNYARIPALTNNISIVRYRGSRILSGSTEVQTQETLTSINKALLIRERV